MVITRILLLISLGIGLAMPVAADELLLQGIAKEPPNTAQGLPRPKAGMRMDAVRRRFGKPKRVIAPVGKPPITRWVYDKYTVYFEGDRVIHSVVHHPH